jgi:hypothetical protein
MCQAHDSQDICTNRAITSAMFGVFSCGLHNRTSITQQHPLLTMLGASHEATDVTLTIHKSLFSGDCIHSGSFLQGFDFALLDER